MPETAAIKKQREKEGRGKLLTTLLIIETFLLCIGIILFLNPQELIKTSLFYKISPATYILWNSIGFLRSITFIAGIIKWRKRAICLFSSLWIADTTFTDIIYIFTYIPY